MKNGSYGSASTTTIMTLSSFLTILCLPSPVTSSFIEGLFSTNTITTIKGNHRSRISTFLASDLGGYNDGDDDNEALFGRGGLVPEDVEKKYVPKKEDEDNPSGGSMFKAMMERAKKSNEDERAQPQQTLSSSPLPPVKQQPSPIPQVVQPSPQATVDPMTLYRMQLEAWQGQMTALAKFMTDNPSAASSMTLPPPPEIPNLEALASFQQQQQLASQQQQLTPPQQQQQSTPPQQQQQKPQQKENLPSNNFLPKPLPGKKGNKDTFDIQNSADLYLAQLKRDTFVRTEARVSGDITTANSPFSDDSVKQLGGYLSDELIELRREQLKKETQGGVDVQRIQQEIEEEEAAKGVVEEARLERIRVKRSKESSTVGLSYREKLAEAKRRRIKDNDGGGDVV